MEVIMDNAAWRVWSGLIGVALCVGNAGSARADDAQVYGFEAAAQEITQLFWLADTARVCGWASEEDAAKFKHFSVRFVSAYMTGAYRAALLSLITDDGYEDQVRRAAEQSAEGSCQSARWETGWVAYKAAAEAHETEF
jgi:hypothetical protein